MESVHSVVLGLGTNMGRKLVNLEQAIKKISDICGNITKYSGIWKSNAWGFESANTFLNLCLELEVKLLPEELLKCIKGIEEEMGRTSVKGAYTDRIIDIDILFYDDLVLDMPGLIIPHPHIASRSFVLLPLEEICPAYLHPGLKRSISELSAACSDPGKAVRL